MKFHHKHSAAYRVGSMLRDRVGRMTLDQLTSTTANELIEGWQAEGYAQATVFIRAHALKRLFRHLNDCGAPSHILRGLIRVKRGSPRKVTATQEEIAAILANAVPWLQCFIVITVRHGLRIAEACRLAEVHYNRAEQQITYPTKGGDANSLPATAELQEFFRTAPPSPDRYEPLLDRIRGYRLGKTATYEHWRKLLKKSRVNPNLHPHDLRRTLATAAWDATKDLKLVQELLGHRSMATTALYIQHISRTDLRPILEGLTRGTPAHSAALQN